MASNDAQWVILLLYPAFRRKIEILPTLGYRELSWYRKCWCSLRFVFALKSISVPFALRNTMIYYLQLTTESSLAEAGASLLPVRLACSYWEGGAEARGGVGSRRDNSHAIASKQRSEFLAVLCS